MNDFQLHSGERQTGTRLEKIRADHVARYELASQNISRIYSNNTSHLSGLDCFCGNGYGSYILSNELKCNVHGIDASEAAINQANAHYKLPTTTFETAYFPFDLHHEKYDFITSIESIEHVEDSAALINMLIYSLKPGGYMFASVPNADMLSLEKNPNKFHYRHFNYMDFLKLTNVNDVMSLHTFYGQDTYLMSNGVVSGYMPPSMMKMKHRYIRGQFLFFVLQKVS